MSSSHVYVGDLYRGGQPLVSKPVVAKDPKEAFREFIKKNTDLCTHYWSVGGMGSDVGAWGDDIYFNRRKGVLRTLLSLPIIWRFNCTLLASLDLAHTISWQKRFAHYKDKTDILVICVYPGVVEEVIVRLEILAMDFTNQTGIKCDVVENFFFKS